MALSYAACLILWLQSSDGSDGSDYCGYIVGATGGLIKQVILA